jgi:hypothetical protein
MNVKTKNIGTCAYFRSSKLARLFAHYPDAGQVL